MINKEFIRKLRLLLKEYIRKVGILFIGVMIMTFGGTILVVTELGGDSIVVFEQGFAVLLGLGIKDGLGTAILILNILLTIVVFFIDKKMINIGTIVVTFTAGPLVAFYLASNIIPEPTLFANRLILTLIGCIICSFGAAVYIFANVGYAPFEGIMMIVSKRFNIRFAIVKVVNDIILFGLGYLMGGIVGVGSIMTIIIFGPAIDFYLRLFNKRKNKNIIKPV